MMGFLTEIIIFAGVGIVVAVIFEICRRCLTEYENWRRCAGRSAFWPLIH